MCTVSGQFVNDDDDDDGDDGVDGVDGDDDIGVGDGGYDNESVLSEFNGLGQKSLEVLIMVKRIRMTLSIFWGRSNSCVPPVSHQLQVIKDPVTQFLMMMMILTMKKMKNCSFYRRHIDHFHRPQSLSAHHERLTLCQPHRLLLVTSSSKMAKCTE